MDNIYIKQSTTFRVVFRAFDAATGLIPQTGKTIAITISKNAGAFGNPSAGATNATEIANGWYYVDLSTTDTNTLGPLIVRGTADNMQDIGEAYRVGNGPSDINAINGGLTTGYNAELKLKQLDIRNNAGSAVIIRRTSGSGVAVEVQGSGSGSGFYIEGGVTGTGIYVSGGGGDQPGIAIEGGGSNAPGMLIWGRGTGPALAIRKASAAGLGPALELVGGSGPSLDIIAGNTGGFGTTGGGIRIFGVDVDNPAVKILNDFGGASFYIDGEPLGGAMIGIGFQRGKGIANFPIWLRNADGDPIVGLTDGAFTTKAGVGDGGSSFTFAGTIVEGTLPGLYWIPWSVTESDYDDVAFLFEAPNAVPVRGTVHFNPAS